MGHINPLAAIKRRLEVKKKKGNSHTKTKGIEQEEIDTRKNTGECLRCACPADRKGTHRVKECIGPIRLEKGTASYPKGKVYQQWELTRESTGSSEDSDSEED
jgi:hypothetical protein